MTNEPMLTQRQRHKIYLEIMGLACDSTSDSDYRMLRFVAVQVGRQTQEEVAYCNRDKRGRP